MEPHNFDVADVVAILAAVLNLRITVALTTQHDVT